MRNKKGQATAEYIIITAMMAGIIYFFFSNFFRPWIEETFLPSLESAFENQIFKGPDFREFPIGAPR